MPNKLSRLVAKIYQLPRFSHSYLLTKLFCSQVKFAKTTGIQITEISGQQVVIKLANKKKVQNHIGGIHAIAAAVLAESASGIVFGMNVPDSKLPLLKSMTMHYQRRMQGALTAVAQLTPTQAELIRQQDKGDMLVEVTLTDESGEQPIVCEMHWAWVTKQR